LIEGTSDDKERSKEDPMKIYLASRFSRREEMRDCRRLIHARGGEVTSRWLNDDAGELEAQDDLDTPEGTIVGRRCATTDIADVLAADAVIAFTEAPRGTKTRGGRHVELGIALGASKRVVIVGPRENVFCCAPGVEQARDIDEALELLGVTALASASAEAEAGAE